ncbi:alpha/beta hydrolase family protein [Agaribacter marinus]|uniref:Peptidase S9 prolyl oligopeptidase catalytic domain-containing protein n=1 Tax=Agaribacter marinus TaxID=1431249 RepID=A0AA37T1U5_9ALTE|nr:prolyl oligopeptidase family serine peptidase [Agaribacter marinus]GLR72086.1 hypothetical protein GCM10007852_29940 [Agaribacter marinus]
MIERGSKRKAKTPAQLEQRLNTFKRMFEKDDFYTYKASLECIVFKYKVDDLLVDGYLIKPKGQNDLPLLIYNRGGNGRYGAVIFASLMSNLFPLAEKGFAIIGSQYRGSLGKEVVKGKYDEFGGKDIDDVVKLLDYIPHIQGVDGSRVGMYGSSRGGMQTLIASRRMPSIKALAVQSGASDLLRELENRPEMENVYKIRIPNYSDNKHMALAERSAINWADTLKKNMPILIIHGDQDTKVSVDNAYWLVEKLEEFKHPYKLSIYGGEKHSFNANAKTMALSELATWFHLHL